MDRNRFSREDTFFSDIGKIAAGVFIGALAAMFAYEGVSALRAEYALNQLAQQAQQAMRADRERMRVEQESGAARQQQQQAQAQALQDARDLAQRLQRDREQRRANAWADYYRPSPPCLVDSATMACANEYMAAHKRFDAQYKDR